jgi:hypothetical protein
MSKVPSRTRSEQKAETIDAYVKAELARTKALNEAKTARLKALRLARDEANPVASQQPKAVPRKAMRLRRYS